MRRYLAWWVVLGLLLIAWVPFGVEELIDKLRGPDIPDEEVAFMFGFWLFVWWPCNILAALITLYKLTQWVVRYARTSKS